MERLLEILRAGNASRSDLYGLSNLSREEAQTVWAVWTALPVDQRRRMAQTLVEIAESDFEVSFGEVLRLALGDEDAEVRRAAVEGLWEDEDVRLVPALVTCLVDPVAEVRAAAAASLGRFLLLGELEKIRPGPYRKALNALLTVCTASEESVEVRRRALESLAYSGEEAVAGLIQDAYEVLDEPLRISAVFAMGRSADRRWAEQVMQELESSNPEMRYEAARACGELALEDAVPTLVELAEDVDTEVRQAAVWPLGQIGGDEARRVLESCTRLDDEALREAAREALRELEFLHGDLGTFLLFDFFEEDDREEEEGLW